jgi:hypothetical protein
MKFIDISQANSFPEPRDVSPEELKKIHALFKEQFTAADLQRYTELDEGVPFEDMLKALREKQRKLDEQRP